jgi:N-acetylglucosaminyl-diphospho-decaprenol L-rhamnosyltransferase
MHRTDACFESRMSFSIDVVIPTFERWDLTSRCLSRLRDQTVPHEVIVVDNSSTDETRERIRHDFPEVQLLELSENLGFPVACNRGAAAGAADVIVLLNNDVEARPDFLERLVAPLGRGPLIASVASVLVQPGERTIDCVGLTVDKTLAGFPRLRGRPVTEAASGFPMLTGPAGAGGAYRRAAWEEVGGLDEGVLFYGEDVDLALRLRSAGGLTAAATDAVAVHLGSASIGLRSARQRYQSGFARAYFLRRYRRLFGRAAARTLVTEGIVVLGDALLSHDVSAARGRFAGWRAAKGAGRSPTPPPEAIDETIGFLDSLSLRRKVY